MKLKQSFALCSERFLIIRRRKEEIKQERKNSMGRRCEWCGSYMEDDYERFCCIRCKNEYWASSDGKKESKFLNSCLGKLLMITFLVVFFGLAMFGNKCDSSKPQEKVSKGAQTALAG